MTRKATDMTVKELRAALAPFPDEAVVVLRVFTGDWVDTYEPDVSGDATRVVLDQGEQIGE